jgi:transketolase
MRAQFPKTIVELADRDPRVFVLLGDIGVFGFREFSARWPSRFLNAGIREQAMASAAGGLAKVGFIPFIHSITPFVVERCFEQIKVGLGYHELPGNVVSVGAGIDYSALGCTHHSHSDIALFRSLPRARIFAPGSPAELHALMIRHYDKGLNYFRLGGRDHDVTLDVDCLADGRGTVVASGTRLTIAAYGPLLSEALRARQSLARPEWCEIIYHNTLKPFDPTELIKSTRKTGRLITIEDHSRLGGFGDTCASALTAAGVSVRHEAIGLGDHFVHDYGSYDQILDTVGLSAAGISRRLNAMLEESE